MSEQRSKEWFEARSGKFTSSRINELMGAKGLGKTGESYAFDLSVEMVQGRDEEDDYMSYDMQRGVELEPYAFKKFSELMSLRFSTVTKCGFIELNENTGSSPDGLVDDDGVLEIKCPKSSTFFKVVLTGEIDKKYYDQMQHQMYCTGRSKAYFFNYCIYNGEELWHLIEVERDQDRIDLMRSRIDEAVAVRDGIVKQLKENRQWS